MVCWVLKSIGVLKVRRRRILGIRVDGRRLVAWTGQGRDIGRSTEGIVANIGIDLESM